MYTLRKWIVGLGVGVLLILVALVAVSLYALTRKESNYDRIAGAMRNRWKPKDENGTSNSKVDASNSNNGHGTVDDLAAVQRNGSGSASSESGSQESSNG